MQNFRKLQIWKRGIDIIIKTYQLTKTLPAEGRFGLASQMTLASVSILANIAEGGGRKSKKEFHQYIQIALDSSFELETQLIIAGQLSLISQEQASQLQQLIIGEQKMIKRLLRKS